MTRLFVGHKPGVGPVLKVMRNDGDDPLTVPKTDYAKYKFDSETTQLGYVDDIFNRPFVGGYPFSPWTCFPAGSNTDNCTSAVSTSGTGPYRQEWRYPQSYFGLPFLPMFESRQISAGNEFAGPGSIIGDSSGGWFTAAASSIANTGGDSLVDNDDSPNFYHWRQFFRAQVHSTDYHAICSVWGLPADQTALQGVGTPSAGQEVIKLSPGITRVARPGYDVVNGDPRNFIMHENHIPAKVMAAGDILLPSYGSKQATITIPPGFTLTPTTYMDYHARRDTSDSYNLAFYSPPLIYNNDPGSLIGFTYKVNSNTVTLINRCAFSLIIRYMILADSDAAHTTGGSKILYKGTVSGVDFLQIKRPGSSDTTPNLNDIMLDTRLQYLPLLKEGFIPWSSGFPGAYSGGDRFYGERYVDVPITNPTRMKLFVKHRLVLPTSQFTSDGNTTYFDGEIREPRVTIFVDAGSTWTGRMNQLSSYARIDPGEKNVRFSMAGNNKMYINTDDPYRVTPSGIRYYVFGIAP